MRSVVRTAPLWLTLAALTACTGSSPDPVASPSQQSGEAPPPSASPSGPSVEEFEQALRARLRVPALPSFTLPTDLLSSPRDEDVRTQLGLQPGLYDGIAVVGARCEPDGEARSADSGTPLTGAEAAGTFKDGERTVTVAGDGTGVYDAPGLHIAVLADGTGVYDDGATRLSVRPGGGGTFANGNRRYNVDPGGTGSYEDDELRFWVGPSGSGGFDDGTTRVSRNEQGIVSKRGDDARAAVVEALIAEGLPRFPPVPRIVRVAPSGPTCGTIVRLDASVLFGFDDVALAPEARELLVRVADLLEHLEEPAVVAGHTDGVGAEDYNQELSRRRASSVRDELVRLGVPPGSLEAQGLGEGQPLRPEALPDGTDDPAARQLNRRVELVLREG
jgi:OOP family OmpA-OmpF porin